MLMRLMMRTAHIHVTAVFLVLSLVGLTTSNPCSGSWTTQRPWTTSRPVSLQNGTCNFDDIQCWFIQNSKDQLDFTIYRGSTPSVATGPSADYTSGHGKYIYAEASGQIPGSRARMHTYLFLRHSACLFFRYHMFGADMGTLKVYVNDRLEWELHGNQGNQWTKATIPVQLSASGMYKIEYEAVIGNSFRSDIALDDFGFQEYYSIDKDVCDITPSCAKPTAQPTVLPSPPPTFPPHPPQNVSCGVPAIPPARIIGGVDARPGSWPWQVAIKISGFFFCGGTLIAPRWVLTAAHCIFQGLPHSSYEIVVGEHNQSIAEGTEQSVYASNITVHPSWNATRIDTDIALIYLSRPVMINDRIKPACLPRQDEIVPRNASCYITGWGKIHHPGGSHHTLQQARLPLASRKCCQKKVDASPAVPSHIKITDNMICAGKKGSIKSGCHGDSGGPFVCQARDGRWVLQGAVSWGSPRCDTRDAFSVFARVARFRNWIDYHMRSVR
ncbi:plasminogen-like [Actinia tenebrosa]|uniref:Plasminogen-like n=1 Tax=Actinia tenebrosa TaxID=6105 RepID=A0A6P8ING9_ACTTE|nr:plasminogen-like [Actinia tenebrosa]